jgi:hypothetical protein
MAENTNEHFGDQLLNKDNKYTRIYFQNINSVQPQNYNKWKDSLEWIKSKKIDICALAEPCINAQNK